MTANTKIPPRSVTTLADLLQWRAEHNSDDPAFIFLVDGKTEEGRVSFEALHQQAQAIGGFLQETMQPGERALLLYPQGLDYLAAFFGCLYAGVIAVPAYPPNPAKVARTMPRLQAIIDDAGAGIVLTNTPTRATIEQMLTHESTGRDMRCVATDGLAASPAAQWKRPAIDSYTLAFLQYTSGSTSTPKGVMVSHGNLLANHRMIQSALQHEPGMPFVSWLPLFHDMGLIMTALQAVYVGELCVLMAPLSFVRDPIRWLRAISRYRAHTSGAPNFAYELCTQKVSEAQLRELDLSCWGMAYNGAEPVRPGTLDRFAEKFAPCGFRREALQACYGLAEASVFVSGGIKSDPPVVRTIEVPAYEQGRVVLATNGQVPTRDLVGCGRAWEEEQIRIVDPVTHTLCPPGRIGEIWVGGPHITQGYWGRPAETEQTFGARILDTGEGPYMRTGDLGFFLDDELFITSRCKDLIIIDGSNYYPQDIEQTVEACHPALRLNGCAAFSIEVDEEERLVIAAEVDRRYRPASKNGENGSAPGETLAQNISLTIRRTVGQEHNLPVYEVVLLQGGGMPKTSSGKVQRQACRQKYMKGTLDIWEERKSAAPGNDPAPAPTTATPPLRSAQEIQDWIFARVSGIVGIAVTALNLHSPFDSFGLTSRQAVTLSKELEDWLGRPVSQTILWDYPNTASLSRYLAGEAAEQPAQAEAVALPRSPNEPIAIIGMGCRFPGGATSPAAFWSLLQAGSDAITEVPAERWAIDEFYDPDPSRPGTTYTRWGGFIQDIEQFDPEFFGISGREAGQMDPQQRLTLEVAWEALEHAGQTVDRLAGSQTGVFIGVHSSSDEYAWAQLAHPLTIDTYTGTGTSHSVIAGRLSYLFDLRGPSLAIDTACSSSLVAVHLACQSLLAGESDLALAGGVNLLLDPQMTICASRMQIMSPEGRCKAFDAGADGFVRSEGCGMVVLKRLADAQADGDPILAVIRGSAVNQDGASNGLTAPNGLAQQAVIRQALAQAGITPAQVGYIEAHGTGTPLGDPIEVEALARVYGQARPDEHPCFLGSVKTNIGHLEGAAGIAGLMKAALALAHGQIPPHLHLNELNPTIARQGLPFTIPSETVAWPANGEQPTAAVSSFGWSGTNAHVIVEAAPVALDYDSKDNTPAASTYLLPLSARSPEALRASAQAYQQFLAAATDRPTLGDICYTAGVRRSHHPYRLAVVGHDRQEIVGQLDAFLNEEAQPGLAWGHASTLMPRLAFVFPGQGSQWLGMGRALMRQEAAFREMLERCDTAMRQYVDWSLLEELQADGERSRLEEIAVVQPVLFAIQVALAALWRSWGVEPDAVIGQSMGEVAAAYVAGALTLDDACRVICRRSRLLRHVSGRGAMAMIELGMDQTQAALAGYEDRLSIAVSSSSTSTVISGDLPALNEVLETLQARGVYCKLVKVDVASHSPQVDILTDVLFDALQDLRPQAASIPFFSTVSAGFIDGATLDAGYWMRNLRRPVLFAEGLRQLSEGGFNTFIEISPHPILLSAMRQELAILKRDGTVLPSLRREADERAELLNGLAALYTRGYPVDWQRFYPVRGHYVDLPTYPWQHAPYWFDRDKGTLPIYRRLAGGAAQDHPWLHHHVRSAVHTGTHFWSVELSCDRSPFLADHRVQGAIVFPAAAALDLVLSAAAQTFGPGQHNLEQVVFHKALQLPETGASAGQLVFSQQQPQLAVFHLFSTTNEGSTPTDDWTLHVSGRLQLTTATPDASPITNLEAFLQASTETRSQDEVYAALAARSLQYGPAFRGVLDLWRGEGTALGQIRGIAASPSHAIHPTLLDSCFHVVAALLPGDEPQATFLPVEVGNFRLYRTPAPGETGWSFARLSAIESDGADYVADVFLLDQNHAVLAETRGLRLHRIDRQTAARQAPFYDWLYELAWQPVEQPEAAEVEQAGAWLLFANRENGRELAGLLAERGAACIVITAGETYRRHNSTYYTIDPAQPTGFQRLLQAVQIDHPGPLGGVVHCWNLDVAARNDGLDDLHQAYLLGNISLIHLVQALAETEAGTRLWVVTRGVQPIEDETSPVHTLQGAVWGLARVITHEYPGLRSTLVDLPARESDAGLGALVAELFAGSDETQVALRGGARYVARLQHWDRVVAGRRQRVAADQQPYRLVIDRPGMLDDLRLRAIDRRPPGPGEVEIQVVTAGLNFLDVLGAMGIRPDVIAGEPVELGRECAGKITAIGEGVDAFRVDDQVIAIAAGCFGSHVTTSAALVVHKPTALHFEEAATIPIAFTTAFYALHHLGRLKRGERILIHSASGGTGLAAIQLAQQAGAEIFATAGSEEKRAFLHTLGIAHVFDSRSLDFAEQIMAATQGQGVDVILNSLTGEAIARGLAILSPYGRFLEIGKKDIYQNSRLGLSPFRQNLSYFAIDLARLVDDDPQFVGTLLQEIVQQLERGDLQALPHQVVPVSAAAEAFRQMAQAKHRGKLVLRLPHDAILDLELPPRSAPLVRADGTYLLTGGMGGLGLVIARWLVDRGARHLVLAGRSKPSDAARETIAALEALGANVRIARIDISLDTQVSGLLEEIADSMPPLRGIFHAAAVLDDRTIGQLDQERFISVAMPKANGAWLLHLLTADLPLDHFVLFSSAASVLGSPGQGNYAAANALLDALAHHRHACGLPALSINWGPWAEVGLAARAEREGRLAARGIGSITPEQGCAALDYLLRQDCPQVSVLPFDVNEWQQFYPGARALPLLRTLAEAQSSNGTASAPSRLNRAALAAAAPDERKPLIEQYLSEQIIRILGLSTQKLNPQQPMNRLGLDSLMAVEVKNRVEADLSVQLALSQILRGPSIAELAAQILGQLALEAPETASVPDSPEALDLQALLAQLDDISDDRVDALLQQMAKEKTR